MLTQQLLKVTSIGGEWVLWLLIGMSFLSIGAMVDRWWFFRSRAVDIQALGKSVLGFLKKGDRAGAMAVLAAHPSVEAAVVHRCLEWVDDGNESMEEVLAATVRDFRPMLDKGTLLLGTIGNNAPFVGLLGTVLGVVQAFRHLEGGPSGDMGAVMATIAEALIATASGIAVAIPAVVAYNHYTTKSAAVEQQAQSLMNMVMAQQKSTRQASQEPGAAPLQIAGS